MPDMAPVGSSVQRCWQIMTGLHVATRAEAIEFLRAADCLTRLSTTDIRIMVETFPLMPAAQGQVGGPLGWPSGGAR